MTLPRSAAQELTERRPMVAHDLTRLLIGVRLDDIDSVNAASLDLIPDERLAQDAYYERVKHNSREFMSDTGLNWVEVSLRSERPHGTVLYWVAVGTKGYRVRVHD